MNTWITLTLQNKIYRERINLFPILLNNSIQLLHELRLERKRYLKRFVGDVHLVIRRAAFIRVSYLHQTSSISLYISQPIEHICKLVVPADSPKFTVDNEIPCGRPPIEAISIRSL